MQISELVNDMEDKGMNLSKILFIEMCYHGGN